MHFTQSKKRDITLMNVFQSLGSTLTDGYSPALLPNASRIEEHLRLHTKYVENDLLQNGSA